jgi:hypothetical protein
VGVTKALKKKKEEAKKVSNANKRQIVKDGIDEDDDDEDED